MAERLYSARQVADLLGAAPATVAAWIERGWLAAERLPAGRVGVTEAALVRFLKDRGVDLADLMAALVRGEARAAVARAAPAAAEGPASPVPRALASAPAAPSDSAPPARAAEPSAGRPAAAAAAGRPASAAAPPAAPAAGLAAAPPPSADGARPRAAQGVRPGAPAPGPAPAAPADAAQRLLEAILRDAVGRGAGAVHLESRGGALALRLRVGGRVYEKVQFAARLPAAAGRALVARVKRLAGLAPAAARRAGAGEFALRVAGRDMGVTVAACPTAGGESLVLHLADRDAPAPVLEELGLAEADLAVLRQALAAPAGLLAVVAPLGGGARTLGALASALRAGGRRLALVEHRPGGAYPPALRLRPGEGFTAADAVRAASAQDADAVLLEALHEAEAGRACLDAAAAGRLVVARVASRWPATDPALLPLAEGDRGLLAEVLAALAAQRTLRRLCPACKVLSRPRPDLAKRLGLRKPARDLPVYMAPGCPACGGTGCAGEADVYAVLAVDEGVARLLREGADAAALEEAGRRAGSRTLRERALDVAWSGAASLEEVARVLGA